MMDLLALLEYYNTCDHDNLFYDITKGILEQYDDLQLDSLQAFAESLHVSPSSLGRYLKNLYYDNFTTFRTEHLKRQEYYLFDHDRLPTRADREGFRTFTGSFLTETQAVLDSMDESKTEQLAGLLESREKIIFVGLPMPSEIWWLEMELVLLGKRTSAFQNPNDQVEELLVCQPGDLVIGLDFMRQDDIFLERALEEAHKRGATTVCLSHMIRRADTPYIDLLFSYCGTNTRGDQMALTVLLNYLGDCLRRK